MAIILKLPVMTVKMDTPPNRIREWRKLRDMGQADLGEAIGVTAVAISNFELGRRPLTVETMRAIARVLNIDPVDLLEKTDNPLAMDEESRQFLRVWRNSPPSVRAAVQSVAENLSGFTAEPDIRPFPSSDEGGERRRAS